MLERVGMSGRGAVNHLGSDKIGLFALGSMRLQEVGEEKQLQNDENDKKFDEDDGPQRPSQFHGAETVVI